MTKTKNASKPNTSKQKDSEESASETLQDLDSLTKALQGDLSSIDPDAAIKMIDDWQSLVKQSKDSEFKEIGTGLKELQKLLKSDKAGQDLGELLVHLGEQTSDVSSNVDKELKMPIQNLGKQLATIGRSLAKEDDRLNQEAINSLMEVIDQDLEKIDTKAAVGGIDYWYELLSKSEDKNLKEISTELKELKKLLTGNKSKPTDLSKKLIKLGEQTTEAAENAGKGFKGITQKLGKSLIKIGGSLDTDGE